MPFGRRQAAKLALAGLVAVSALFPITPSGAQQAVSTFEAISPDTVVSGEVIVVFEPGIPEEVRERELALVQGVLIRSLDGGAVVVKVPVGSEVSASASLELRQIVLSAEPNDRVRY